MGSMIRSAPLEVFLMMVGVFVAMAGIAVFAGLRARKRAALMQGTPKSNIGMAEDGYRHFAGTTEAIGGKLLTLPLTKSPCIWFHAKVEQWMRSPTSSSSSDKYVWQVVTDVTSSEPFLVRDTTGACVVYPDDAEVTPTDKSLWHGATMEPKDTRPAKVRPGESATPILEISGGPNAQYRYSEERIYAGDPLVVFGDFRTGLTAPEPVYVEGTTELADEEDPDEEALALQAAARTKASVRVGSGDAPPFILSTTPQRELVDATAKGGAAALGIAVVPLAIAALIVWVRFS